MKNLFPLLLLPYLVLYPLPSLSQEEANAPIRQHSITIGKLQKEISNHENKIQQTDQQEVNLLVEMEAIDQKVVAQHQLIEKIRQLIDNQEQLILDKENELKLITVEQQVIRDHLQKRLKAYYLMGKTGVLSITFSSENLPDLLVFNDSFRELLTYDQEIITSFRESVAKVQRAKQSHQLEKTVQLGFLQRADSEKTKLAALHQEKQQLLTRVTTQKGLYQQALKEMQKAEGNLISALTNLKKKEEKKTRGFLLSKGRLQAPVSGKLIATFNPRQTGDSQESISLTQGITIQTAEGAQVHAVYRGKVIYAGYMRGYGKMVIIDHGLQYYTVTARFDKLICKEGEQVKQGQLIGLTGDIATLFGKGMYFEVRQGATPLDPLEWLAPNAFKQP